MKQLQSAQAFRNRPSTPTTPGLGTKKDGGERHCEAVLGWNVVEGCRHPVMPEASEDGIPRTRADLLTSCMKGQPTPWEL